MTACRADIRHGAHIVARSVQKVETFFRNEAVVENNVLHDLIVETANGKLAKNEINETKEIAIFKTGVTL